MDREEKSSSRHRDSDRDNHYIHHSSSKNKSDDNRCHSHSHHRSKYGEDSIEREKSAELRSEPEVDRHRNRSREHGKSKDREKSYDREDSTERKNSKRKERGSESGEDSDGGVGAKRVRVLEDRNEKRKKFEGLSREGLDEAKKILQRLKQLQEKCKKIPVLNKASGVKIPPLLLDVVTIQPKPAAKAHVLRLDALGREIDEHGNLVNVPKVNTLSTLKVNINNQRKDAFQILKPELEVDPSENPHFDPRMGINKTKILRPKRMSFQFVEEGKWSKDAEMLRFKSQFGEVRAKELKAKQAQLDKAKAETNINPNLIEVSERKVVINKEKKPKEEVIPEVEWWDIPFLPSGNYNDIIIDGDLITDDKLVLKMDKITIYVEHPRPIEPPAEPTPPPPQPLKLTKKEQKKLRTQCRLEREKDKQEMIRKGLLEPPKPKLKMSNLHRVTGTEAAQNPTKLEMETRRAALEREQAHIDRNIARKLTPAERREKKDRKLFDGPNIAETMVSVYKVGSLANPQARFKVDANAHENRLTGCAAVISEGICVVVVEGCPKSIKRYGKLMLRRINWAAAVVKNDEEDEDDDINDGAFVNKCMLLWQGSVAKSSFHRFSIQECLTEAAARKIFSDAGVGHYWDLALAS
ncbi:OLC1v1023390C1 [Oldenlandia corymbosa var. corymbosa]|uniref:OLC1v1023390C1 n=1 Tax=Oldenlandia corymbosa var. corymbosa TaxID=529605 RepID=A0AAV1BZW5_OLDCO|nr:OLC1v1023390C1 [Oldenlandia corymbosa var. corymbosa]